MAQTIALQRGTTSIAALDGSTKYTMFTQSGGTATRVIINGVSMYASAARNGMSMIIGVQKSGGGFFTVAYKTISNNGTYGGFDFFPGNINNISGGLSNASSTASLQTVMAANLASAYPANQVPKNAFLSGGNSATNGYGASSNYEFCPTQFWVGPSDIVYFKGQNVNEDAGEFSWSLTTITES
jgi:hypothetical protein